jgi:hypothetical protein
MFTPTLLFPSALAPAPDKARWTSASRWRERIAIPRGGRARGRAQSRSGDRAVVYGEHREETEPQGQALRHSTHGLAGAGDTEERGMQRHSRLCDHRSGAYGGHKQEKRTEMMLPGGQGDWARMLRTVRQILEHCV